MSGSSSGSSSSSAARGSAARERRRTALPHRRWQVAASNSSSKESPSPSAATPANVRAGGTEVALTGAGPRTLAAQTLALAAAKARALGRAMDANTRRRAISFGSSGAQARRRAAGAMPRAWVSSAPLLPEPESATTRTTQRPTRGSGQQRRSVLLRCPAQKGQGTRERRRLQGQQPPEPPDEPASVPGLRNLLRPAEARGLQARPLELATPVVPLWRRGMHGKSCWTGTLARTRQLSFWRPPLATAACLQARFSCTAAETRTRLALSSTSWGIVLSPGQGGGPRRAWTCLQLAAFAATTLTEAEDCGKHWRLTLLGTRRLSWRARRGLARVEKRPARIRAASAPPLQASALAWPRRSTPLARRPMAAMLRQLCFGPPALNSCCGDGLAQTCSAPGPFRPPRRPSLPARSAKWPRRLPARFSSCLRQSGCGC